MIRTAGDAVACVAEPTHRFTVRVHEPHGAAYSITHVVYNRATCTRCTAPHSMGHAPDSWRTTYDMRTRVVQHASTHATTSWREGSSSHLQRDAVEDQFAETDRVPDEVRAAVAQHRRDGEPQRLHHEEAQQARRADRSNDAVDEARRLAMQPSDGAHRREARAHLVHDLRIQPANVTAARRPQAHRPIPTLLTFVSHMNAQSAESRGPAPLLW